MNSCKKDKSCKRSFYLKGAKDNYICSGITKPKIYKKDIISLCLKGELSQKGIEMTREEAIFLITALGSALTTDCIK
jgi:hypothetical protein